MEYAVCAASSDSEDVTDSEEAATALEEDRVASNTGQQGPNFEVAAESTSDAQESSGFAFINKVAFPRKSWDSLDTLKVEAAEKPNHEDIQNLIHFAKYDGNQVPVPGGVHATLFVNSSEETGPSYGDLEDHTMQMICEDDEQELVTEGNFDETTEEVKFRSSTSEIGVSQKQNPTRSEVQRKRNLLGGQKQTSKLVKRSEQPQKSFQTSHQERNHAAKEPREFAQNTELSRPSSKLMKRREVNIGAVSRYKCPKCNRSFSTKNGRRAHKRVKHKVEKHKVEKHFTCSKCTIIFDSMLLRDWHCATAHNIFGRITCLKCGDVYPNQLAIDNHKCIINVLKPVSFPCTECNLQCSSISKLFDHRISTHRSPFK